MGFSVGAIFAMQLICRLHGLEEYFKSSNQKSHALRAVSFQGVVLTVPTIPHKHDVAGVERRTEAHYWFTIESGSF